MKKSEIKALIKETLEKNKKIKGTYLGQKGVFFDFKTDSSGKTIAKFRTDGTTNGGLKKSTWGINIKSNDVKLDTKNIKVEEVLEDNKSLTGNSKIISKEFGGIDDREFLKIVWKLTIDELDQLVLSSLADLKFLNKNSRGIFGVFNRRDANIVKGRINWVKQIIKSKKKNPDFIPEPFK